MIPICRIDFHSYRQLIIKPYSHVCGYSGMHQQNVICMIHICICIYIYIYMYIQHNMIWYNMILYDMMSHHISYDMIYSNMYIYIYICIIYIIYTYILIYYINFPYPSTIIISFSFRRKPRRGHLFQLWKTGPLRAGAANCTERRDVQRVGCWFVLAK